MAFGHAPVLIGVVAGKNQEEYEGCLMIFEVEKIVVGMFNEELVIGGYEESGLIGQEHEIATELVVVTCLEATSE